MFPIVFFSFLFGLAILGAFAIKYEWLHGKPMSDEETVSRYLAGEKSAKRWDKIIKFVTFVLMIIFLFIFFYWTFGRFIMWLYYIFF